MWCSTGRQTARLPETTGQKAAIAASEAQSGRTVEAQGMCGKAAQRGQSAAATRMGKADDRNAKGQLNELAFLKMAGAAGLEPATIGFGDRCSTNSNYAPA